MEEFVHKNFKRIRLYANKRKAASADAGDNTCLQPPLRGLLVSSSDIPIAGPPGDLTFTTSGPITDVPEGDPQIAASSLAADTTTDVAFVVTTNNTEGVAGPSFDTFGFYTWSFIIENASPFVAPAYVILQLSPDNIIWTDDSILYTVPNTNDIVTLVANRFMRYARVFYAAVNAASTITLIIFFQGQG